MNKHSRARFCNVWLFSIWGLIFLTVQAYAAEPIKIGVLAYRDKTQALAQWQPLAQALKQSMPGSDFSVEVYTLPELDVAVMTHQIDFLLTNPSHYVKLSRHNGLSAPLATMIKLEDGQPLSVFGGVVFTRADHLNINTLADIKGKTVAAVSSDSLGGYLAQVNEMRKTGMPGPGLRHLIKTGQPHDLVVEAVMSGRAEVGFVRTGVLESLIREGRLDESQVRVINRQHLTGFPVVASTRLYPEWPFAAMLHVDEHTARRVAAALFNLEDNMTGHAKKIGIRGFGVPADYTSIVDLLREMRAPPFDIPPKFTLRDVVERYRWQLFVLLAGIVSIIWLSVHLVGARRRLRSEHEKMRLNQQLLQESQTNLQAIFNAIPDLLFDLGLDGKYYSVHASNDALLADSENNLLGKTVQQVLPVAAAEVVLSALQEAYEHGHSQGKQFQLPLAQGKRWFELSVAKKNAFSVLPRFIVLSRDVTQRKQAVAYDNFRAHMLELLVNGAEVHELLVNITQGVEKLNSDMICSVLLVNNEGTRLVDAVAPSLPEFYNQAVNNLEIAVGIGCCGTAAATRQRVIAEDLQTHPYWQAYRTLVDRAGLRACWSQPIISSTGQVLGTFAIYHRYPYVPNEEDTSVVEQAAYLVSIAIERKLAEIDLQIAATAFDSQESLMVTDANRTILRVNKSFCRVTGYSPEEVIGRQSSMFRSGRQDDAFYAEMWTIINRDGMWQGEIWNKRKNGEIYPGYISISAIKNEQGEVTNYVSTLNDITESKAAAEEIQSLAFYDPLTGLPNRRLLVDRLSQAVAATRRTGNGGALLFLDLDHFKTLNDTLGHDLGDLLLQQVGERLTSCVREGDTVARLGGDEFVVMLEDLSTNSIEAATQVEYVGLKILDALNRPYQLDMHEYHSTPSIGVALFSDHGNTQEELLKHADIAMYQAKKAGRNTLRFFDPEMQEAINGRAALEAELRKALDRKQFELYYQMQVNGDGHPLGAEVLIRWVHPERGLIPPCDFIPLAEETGLIVPIGEWVVDTACAQIKIWQAQPKTKHLTLSVNVSAKQFRQPDFVSQIQAMVEHYGINPMLLKLELTESMLLDQVEKTVEIMGSLKEIGIRFSLDDFGTGYSSLQYLKKLPLYQLKIDQSFVRDIAVDVSDQAIVRTIIAMAQTLNLSVIAEGVETERQRQLLHDSGCSSYQGYLFAKPVPIAEFEKILFS